MPSVLSEIAYRSKSYWNYPKEWLESWRPELTITQSQILENHTLLLKVDDQITGFTIICDRGIFLEIDHFWLTPQFIGKGLGSQLMNSLLSANSPTKPLCTLADPHAEAFYAKHGFQVIEQRASSVLGRTLPWMERQNS